MRTFKYYVSSIYMRALYEELVKIAKNWENWEKVIKSEMHLSS